MAADLSALFCVSYQTAPLFRSNRGSAPAIIGVPATSVALELGHGEDWMGELAILIQLNHRDSAGTIWTVQDPAVANVKGVG